MKKFYVSACVLGLLAAAVLAAQAPDLAGVTTQIRAEETNNSKIMWIIHEVADVYGPRLTGTPNLKAADDWAVKTMASWGLANTHLEPWTFQPPSAATPVPGWENVDLEAVAVAPFHGQLTVKPLAWTPSTKGTVTAEAVMLLPPGLASGSGFRRGAAPAAATSGLPAPMPAESDARPAQPTQAELDAYLDSMKDKVRGRIVLVGKHVEVAEDFEPAPLRRSDEAWKQLFDPNNPNPQRGFGARRPATPLAAGQLSPQQVARAVDRFLVENGALVRVNDAGRAYGVIVAQQNGNYDWTRVVPTLIMRNEDYGRISRILADGTTVRLRVNVQNREYPEGTTVYNAIGEIPGTDKKDEIVMLGGHYDSWHGATGATDNGIGSAMMLEAVRLLEAVHVKPRRTIRIALWSGEEEGLLGSIAYVQQHFGSAENPKPEFAKLDAYFNIDSGTGKPRGANVFGPPAAADMVRSALAPFQDWGFTGARATNSRRTGGTDSTSFNNAGLPGIGLNQDSFDYNTFTHHTNLDTYERIYEEDVREGAVEIASAVYAIAMADQMVPRFAAGQMPAPAPVPAPGSRAEAAR
ncbi:MAG TPA: M20/M25/M40 family metallo-hydrolase [Candidatus Acidoferrales bacterium]|nr:M20/M25/M40 family metallo-hydrolase [Candidatus Acidoferrales bacterium]